MELNKKNMQKIMLLILFAALLFVGFRHYQVFFEAAGFFWGIFFPFVLGAAIAFILNVPMQFLERNLFQKRKAGRSPIGRKAARPASLVLALLLVLLVIFLVITVVIPDLAATIVTVGKSVERAIPRLQNWAMEIFQDNAQISAWIQELELNWNSIIQNTLNLLKAGATSVLSSTWSVTRGIFSAVASLFIGFAFAIYILLQKEKLSIQVKKALYAMLPQKKVERVLYICSLSYRTFSKFVTGQCIEAVILGTMFFVTMTIFRFPYALLVGVLIAFTALIPIFGAFIGCVVGALLILVVSPMKALMFVIMFLILQQIEGNLVYPHVVGGSVGLPSIWVLAAVTIGGNLMGIAGMLIFIPLSSVAYSLFREWVYKRLEEKKIKVT